MRGLLFLLLVAGAQPAAGQRLDYRPVSDDALAGAPRLAYRAVEGDSAPAGLKLQWVLLDRVEHSAQRGRDGDAWDVSALLGGDRDRLWFGSSG
ncbi:MAG TPA: hypothetical protein VFZ91_14450, partial [Allosphingosinicella sp.]